MVDTCWDFLRHRNLRYPSGALLTSSEAIAIRSQISYHGVQQALQSGRAASVSVNGRRCKHDNEQDTDHFLAGSLSRSENNLPHRGHRLPRPITTPSPNLSDPRTATDGHMLARQGDFRPPVTLTITRQCRRPQQAVLDQPLTTGPLPSRDHRRVQRRRRAGRIRPYGRSSGLLTRTVRSEDLPLAQRRGRRSAVVRRSVC